MKRIKVEAIVNSNIDKVWDFWNNPKHIVNWAFASDDWECPYSENDLKVGGKFLSRMSAKDKSSSFDFVGTYTSVVPNKNIDYTMDDGRTVSILFERLGQTSTKVTEEFEMEDINSEELQRNGWQEILNNFKKYTENN